jgi:hypothetical protein
MAPSCMYRACSIPHMLQLPVYVPNEGERADARLYASNVRKYMVRVEALPDTETAGLCAFIWTFMHSMSVCRALTDAHAPSPPMLCSSTFRG